MAHDHLLPQVEMSVVYVAFQESFLDHWIFVAFIIVISDQRSLLIV